MMSSKISTRRASILVACLTAFFLLACGEAPRFARDDCTKSPTPECLLYFAHQAALEIDDLEKRDWRLYFIAKKQFQIGDEIGALATAEAIESSGGRIYAYLFFSDSRVESGDLDSAASFLESVGDPALLHHHQRRQYAEVQALMGDFEGALESLDVALKRDREWRSALRKGADQVQEGADSKHPWSRFGYGTPFGPTAPGLLFYQCIELTAETKSGSVYSRSSCSRRDPKAAERYEEKVVYSNDSTLDSIALRLAQNGQPKAALDFVRRIRGPSQRARTYLGLFERFTDTARKADSELAAHEALAAARLSATDIARVRLLTDAAEAMLQIDMVESAKDALQIAKRDATSAIGDAKRRFWAALAVAEIEGRLGRIQDAWETIEMGLPSHSSSYLDDPDRHTFSQVVRLAGSERYREADFAFSLLVRDPVKEGEILESIADTARRMGQPQAAKSLLAMASRKAERLPPHRADERSSILSKILQQYGHLGDSAAVEQTIPRIFSSLGYFKSTAQRDLAVQSYAQTLLSLGEREAARRMLRRLHRVVYPYSTAALGVLRDAGDLATIEKAVGQIEAPDQRFRALIWVHRGKTRAGSKSDALRAIERQLRAVVAAVLDLADPKDRSKHLENMAYYLAREA